MALKSIFAVHGVPDETVAGNMLFNSYAMNSFASEWGFRITISSPHYPKSNGLAERYVQTINSVCARQQTLVRIYMKRYWLTTKHH